MSRIVMVESRGEGGTTTSSTSGSLMNSRSCAINCCPAGIEGIERTAGFCIESGVGGGGIGARQGGIGGGVIGRSKQAKRKEEKSQEFLRHPQQYLHLRYSSGGGGGGEGEAETRTGIERGHEDIADGDDEPRAKSAAAAAIQALVIEMRGALSKLIGRNQFLEEENRRLRYDLRQEKEKLQKTHEELKVCRAEVHREHLRSDFYVQEFQALCSQLNSAVEGFNKDHEELAKICSSSASSPSFTSDCMKGKGLRELHALGQLLRVKLAIGMYGHLSADKEKASILRQQVSGGEEEESSFAGREKCRGGQDSSSFSSSSNKHPSLHGRDSRALQDEEGQHTTLPRGGRASVDQRKKEKIISASERGGRQTFYDREQEDGEEKERRENEVQEENDGDSRRAMSRSSSTYSGDRISSGYEERRRTQEGSPVNCIAILARKNEPNTTLLVE
ncbi:hypothetical protein CSUI_000534 [Cystoisospora suis]|uniref:Uncharacterized protein n=1 Tax=Cystoisospora suis TaxID=483139 RepID=A0A2C6L0K0_9APIC|nr:hypothetical protein CSUI_000534 [Cystoisospora suis]